MLGRRRKRRRRRRSMKMRERGQARGETLEEARVYEDVLVNRVLFSLPGTGTPLALCG